MENSSRYVGTFRNDRIMIPIIVIGYALLLFFAVLSDQKVFLIGLSVCPFLLLFFPRGDFIAIMIIAFYFSRIYYYRIPMNLMLYQLFMALFIGVSVARRTISKKVLTMSPFVLLGWLTMAWLVFVIAIRGHAMSMLGSSQVGGAAYVHIFLAFGLYIFSGYIVLSERQWKIAIIAMLLMILLQFVANFSVVVSRGQFWYPLMFVKVGHGLTDTFSRFYADAETTRWSILHPLVFVYLLPAFFWEPDRKKNHLFYFLFFSISMLCALLSGFRNRLIHAGSFFFVFLVLSSKKPYKTASFLVLLGVVVLIILISIAPVLPFGMQRVLSMIPGVEVSAEAELRAMQTLEWRRELWNLVFENMHKYMWVGRGFGFYQEEYDSAVRTILTRPMWGGVYSTFVGGHMHQGILDMLIFLGIPGCVLFIVWLLCELIRHIRLHYDHWNNLTYRRYHLAFTAYFIVCVSQFLIYQGGLQSVMMDLIFQMAVLHALVLSDQRFIREL